MEKEFCVFLTKDELSKFQEGQEALAYFHIHNINQKTKIYTVSVTMNQCFSRFRNGTTYLKKSGWAEYV